MVESEEKLQNLLMKVKEESEKAGFIETCIISYKKRITSPGSIQDTGCMGLVHWDDPEGWHGEGGGNGVQAWGTCVHPWWIHVDVWQNQYNIIK